MGPLGVEKFDGKLSRFDAIHDKLSDGRTDRQTDRQTECQTIKNGGLDQYGAERFGRLILPQS